MAYKLEFRIGLTQYSSEHNCISLISLIMQYLHGVPNTSSFTCCPSFELVEFPPSFPCKYSSLARNSRETILASDWLDPARLPASHWLTEFSVNRINTAFSESNSNIVILSLDVETRFYFVYTTCPRSCPILYSNYKK